jgi:hypothetical protein
MYVTGTRFNGVTDDQVYQASHFHGLDGIQGSEVIGRLIHTISRDHVTMAG